MSPFHSFDTLNCICFSCSLLIFVHAFHHFSFWLLWMCRILNLKWILFAKYKIFYSFNFSHSAIEINIYRQVDTINNLFCKPLMCIIAFWYFSFVSNNQTCILSCKLVFIILFTVLEYPEERSFRFFFIVLRWSKKFDFQKMGSSTRLIQLP